MVKNIEKLSFLTPEEKQAVIEFSALLKDKFGDLIKEIIIFGSKIKGEGVQDSDIDILIVTEYLSWEIKKTISELAGEIDLKYNVLISTIRYDVSSWNNPVIMASPFINTVRNEGVWL